jgi:hypothetical protein
MRRRYVGNYARDVQVGEGTQIAEPGGYIEFSNEDEALDMNKELIENGLLIEASNTAPVSKSALPGKGA